ncbi:MAG: hypothetical protein ACRDQV_13450, partial [Pseudonocardiaceae bacterium]
VFEGGFLGLDNIGPIDRSAALPLAGVLEQSDGTAWMAMYCLNLLEMALVSCGFTSTSTETPAPGWAPHIRPAGPDSLRRACCTAPIPLSKSCAPDHGERPDTLSRCPQPRNRPAPR